MSPRLLSRRATRQKSRGGSLLELVTIVVVALGLALGIQAFLVKPFRIPSESMVPTLQVGQRVLVDRVGKHFGDYDRGDILVFKPPAGADTNTCGIEHSAESSCPAPTPKRSDTNFIKRVVAVGGDHVKVLGGAVYINGAREKAPYARLDSGCSICNLPREITIPKGYYFMMGDNRGESADTNTCGIQHSAESACPAPTPKRSSTNFIKRVVAVGGDHVKVLGGAVYINGKRQKARYARLDSGCSICNLPREITIPKGYYFMMGDNRGESADSREWGPIPKKWVIGQAFATYWPPKRIGTL